MAFGIGSGFGIGGNASLGAAAALGRAGSTDASLGTGNMPWNSPTPGAATGGGINAPGQTGRAGVGSLYPGSNSLSMGMPGGATSGSPTPGVAKTLAGAGGQTPSTTAPTGPTTFQQQLAATGWTPGQPIPYIPNAIGSIAPGNPGQQLGQPGPASPSVSAPNAGPTPGAGAPDQPQPQQSPLNFGALQNNMSVLGPLLSMFNMMGGTGGGAANIWSSLFGNGAGTTGSPTNNSTTSGTDWSSILAMLGQPGTYNPYNLPLYTRQQLQWPTFA